MSCPSYKKHARRTGRHQPPEHVVLKTKLRPVKPRMTEEDCRVFLPEGIQVIGYSEQALII